MINDLKIIEKLLFKVHNSKISSVTPDKECKEYFGYNFKTEKISLKFRKAKITPKKVGQFVTLWKRNAQNSIEPYNEADNFDYYIIATRENEAFGFFIFPKNELIIRNVLSTILKEGKRGFRVYPSWNKTQNQQADKSQIWQSKFFIDLSGNMDDNTGKLNAILSE